MQTKSSSLGPLCASSKECRLKTSLLSQEAAAPPPGVLPEPCTSQVGRGRRLQAQQARLRHTARMPTPPQTDLLYPGRGTGIRTRPGGIPPPPPTAKKEDEGQQSGSRPSRADDRGVRSTLRVRPPS
ncbi:hypothetical protein NDU88_005447 [Pleurodeles waltl]|uniref:Uncharacterized protein n=1 Tax=Pleurodeles waltl TaxID=8319 RepID=A0AAV7X0P4_PLEWA|nr:hypothetical protein NDU88_005447 [Pleurodeles waltl]